MNAKFTQSLLRGVYNLLSRLKDWWDFHTMSADEKFIMLIDATIREVEHVENDDGTTTWIFRFSGKEETP